MPPQCPRAPPARACEVADDVRRAVKRTLDDGWRTGDIADAATPADHVVGTAQMGDLVVERL